MASKYLCIVPGSSPALNTQTAVDSIAACLSINPDAYMFSSASLLAQQPTLLDIFNIPISSDLLQMWELGFGLPILCYLTAWGYGSVINFFDKRYP